MELRVWNNENTHYINEMILLYRNDLERNPDGDNEDGIILPLLLLLIILSENYFYEWNKIVDIT